MSLRIWCVFMAGLMGCTQDFGLVDQKVEPTVDTVLDSDGGFDDTDVEPDLVDSDDDVAPAPQLVVTPRFLDFGRHTPGTYLEESVALRNDGNAPLRVSALTLSGSPVFGLLDDSPRTLTAGESATVVVSYTASARTESGELSFRSNDAWLPEVTVGLEGAGITGALEMTGLDFGEVMVNTTAFESMPVTNTGDGPVLITAVQSSDPRFVVELPNPVTVAAQSGVALNVRFTPDVVGDIAGTLTVVSDASPAPQPVAVTGQGVDKPIADCRADPAQVTAIHESTTWVGRDSWDPAGRAITSAQWTLLSAPAGSAATMPGGAGVDRGPFTPDVVGAYTAELVVTNDLGIASDPCVATLHADSNADLWVEMFWQHNEDIDLHLVRGNGSINSADDCYYLNCIGSGLPWGLGGTADDPFLDLDDVNFTGPENINIAAPYGDRYRVVIHDHPYRQYQGANQVTVKIYIYGVLALESVKTVTGEEQWADVAWVDWTVNPPFVTPL